jgi:hypothetical protein
MTLACIRQFLYDWQTFVTGILALIAAGATVLIMRTQTNDERERHADALHRKSLAARAQMPDALSALSHFSQACANWIDSREKEPLTAPTDAINTLKSGIEFVDTDAAAKVFELVSFYQVHNARLLPSTHPIHDPEAGDRLYDTTKLRCFVDRLFPYARNEVLAAPQGNPTQKDMMTALKIITGMAYPTHHKERYERVCYFITKRHA